MPNFTNSPNVDTVDTYLKLKIDQITVKFSWLGLKASWFESWFDHPLHPNFPNTILLPPQPPLLDKKIGVTILQFVPNPDTNQHIFDNTRNEDLTMSKAAS